MNLRRGERKEGREKVRMERVGESRDGREELGETALRRKPARAGEEPRRKDRWI